MIGLFVAAPVAVGLTIGIVIARQAGSSWRDVGQLAIAASLWVTALAIAPMTSLAIAAGLAVVAGAVEAFAP